MTRSNFYPNWEWWLSRTKTHDHQIMYENLAQAIQIDERDTFLEVGCGSGELLKRMGNKGTKIYGSEASLEMIDVAVQNLESSGLSVVVMEPLSMSKSDFREEHKRRDRICLLVDDIENTGIKGNYSYVVSVLQQLAGTSETIQRLWQESAYKHQILPAMIFEQSNVLFFEGMMKVLGNIIPQGGKYLSIDYVVREDMDLEIMGKLALARGFKLAKEPKFVHNPEIYSDTTQVNSDGGYHLLLLQKQ